MKKTKYLFAILFMLVAFLAIGATSVNAETVSIVNNLEEFTSSINDNVDVIKLNADITASDTLHWGINGNKTLDLNGFSINSSKEIMFKIFYYGDYTVRVINSSNSASGKINHTYTADYGKTFYLDNAISGKNKTLYIDGVELNESGRGYTILCFNNNSTDNLIVKNVNSKSFEFSSGFDNYEFSNTVVRPIGIASRARLVAGNSTLTVKDILGDDQEAYYQAYTSVGGTGTKISEGVADENLLVKDLWTTNQNNVDDNAITVRYKNGFAVSNVDLNETYGYTETTSTAKEISIKNRGTSDLQIKNVSVDSSNFTIVNGTQTNLSAGATDTTWKIKANDGLSKGVYTATITVTDMNDNTYTSTVTLTVGAKELTGLGIGGVNSTITYGDSYTPTLTGTTELGSGDYTIKYSQKDGETYKDLGSSKPTGIGEYKVTISITNENYKQIEVSTTYAIVPKEIEPSVGYIAPEKYTGEEITPSITVFNGATMLTKDDDYTFEYANNTNAGKAKVIVKPVVGSRYTFTQFEKEFDILPKPITSESISVTLENTSYRYTGSEIKPEPVVKDGEKLLVKDTDYKLNYYNNTNICDNTAKVSVDGIGNYSNNIIKFFSIIAKEPQTISFDEASVTKTYGDSSFKITANLTQGNGTVKYTSSDTNVAEVNETTGLVTINKAGTTEIKATASETEDYGEESATYTLTVEKKEISINRASAISKEYDGTKTAEVDYIIFNGLIYDETLEKDVDYTATAEFDSEGIGYSKPVTVKVVLKDTAKANNYNLPNAEIQTRSTIRGKAIKEAWVTVDTSTTYTYNGTEIKPAVTVIDPTGETVLTLTKGSHYTVEYTDNINAGTGKIKITGMGNYSGEIEKEFTINKKSITPTIEDIPAVTFNGSEHTPNLVVKDGSTTLIKGTDYTVEYTNNLRPGNGYAEISEVASSNYTFTSIGKDFTINKYEIKTSDVTLEYTSTVFDGNAKKPSVTVKMGNEVIPPADYNVDYSNNTNVGTATVKVTIKADSDDFTGEVTVNFEIVDKTLLTISGINNQQVVYTGSPVVLAGNLTVSNGIAPSDLTVKWYEGTTEISKPTNVGIYKVVYSYEDSDYIGSLTVDFEITKKESSAPTLNTYKAVAGDKLSSITLPTGFKWVDENETIIAGNKEYSATYTTNNDTTNYTTKNINVKVYGKSKVSLNTSVNGIGGTISSSKTDILEETTETITFTPAEGFEISKVEVNGVDKTSSVHNNKLDIVIGNSDTTVVVTYKAIQYTITVKNVENASITPNGIIKVDYNSDKTFTIIAKLGYHLVSVKVNGVEKMSEMVYEELTLKNIKADAEIVVVVERNTYKVIEGANQKYIIDKSNEAKFKIDAKYILFERGGSVYVDNNLVDPSNYTSKDGSTIITLKKEFVDKLSIGEHTLKVLFNDGEATTTFTVEKVAEQEKHEEQEKDNSLNPKTGDNIIIYVAIASISVIGILTTVVLKIKKK